MHNLQPVGGAHRWFQLLSRAELGPGWAGSLLETTPWTLVGPESLMRVVMQGKRRLGTHAVRSSSLTTVPGRGTRTHASRLADSIAGIFPPCYASISTASTRRQLQYTHRLMTGWQTGSSSVGTFLTGGSTNLLSVQLRMGSQMKS
jgi:hypothetical protein